MRSGHVPEIKVTQVSIYYSLDLSRHYGVARTITRFKVAIQWRVHTTVWLRIRSPGLYRKGPSLEFLQQDTIQSASSKPPQNFVIDRIFTSTPNLHWYLSNLITPQSLNVAPKAQALMNDLYTHTHTHTHTHTMCNKQCLLFLRKNFVSCASSERAKTAMPRSLRNDWQPFRICIPSMRG